MKKILELLSILLLFPLSACAYWYKIDDNTYVKTESVKTKGNYLYLNVKYEDVVSLNSTLKKVSPGVMLDSSVFSYMTMDLIVDCKKPRYKTPLILIYGKNNTVINKVKDNTWESDLTKSEWGAYCDLYDLIKKEGI